MRRVLRGRLDRSTALPTVCPVASTDLADMALLIAYAQDLPVADEHIVTIAAREFNRDVAA